MSCLLCEGATAPVLDLGHTPLANELPKQPMKLDTFELRLVRCQDCKHLQLCGNCLVPKERLYRDYLYVQNTGPGAIARLAKLATELTVKYRPTRVVDVGSNDGTFLEMFAGCSRLGVEPDRALAQATHAVNGFFDDAVGADCKDRLEGPADLITALNVFAHNADLGPMLRGVKRLLAPEGVFVAEVTYGPAMIRSGTFDLIYHEHVHHWQVGPLWEYLRRHGLELYEAELIPEHGGSLRFYAKHWKPRKGRPGPNEAIKALMAAEADLPLQAFCDMVLRGKKAAAAIADRLLVGGQKLDVYGWPAKACTLVSYFGLSHVLGRVFDDNNRKVGRYTQFGQLIESVGSLDSHLPDWILCASWNYAEEIVARHPRLQGRWLVPMPTMRAA